MQTMTNKERVAALGKIRSVIDAQDSDDPRGRFASRVGAAVTSVVGLAGIGYITNVAIQKQQVPDLFYGALALIGMLAVSALAYMLAYRYSKLPCERGELVAQLLAQYCPLDMKEYRMLQARTQFRGHLLEVDVLQWVKREHLAVTSVDAVELRRFVERKVEDCVDAHSSPGAQAAG